MASQTNICKTTGNDAASLVYSRDRKHKIKWLRNIKGVERCYTYFLRARYRLYRARHGGEAVVEKILGKMLVVLPEVMNPRLFRTGEFLARCLDENLVPAGSRVLDMGTGSGVGAIFAAQWAGEVLAVDINPVAIKCTRINILLNNLEKRVKIQEGDLFKSLADEKFDLIIFNPPYLKGHTGGPLDTALFGIETIDKFSQTARRHLKPGGRLLLVLSTIANLNEIENLFTRQAWQLEVIREKRYLNETILLYSVVPVGAIAAGHGNSEVYQLSVVTDDHSL